MYHKNQVWLKGTNCLNYPLLFNPCTYADNLKFILDLNSIFVFVVFCVEMQLHIDTEKEENRLLKEQLQKAKVNLTTALHLFQTGHYTNKKSIHFQGTR